MRHLQLSKSLHRNIEATASIKVANISVGAASHTLTVRAFQLVSLTNSTVGVQYALTGEREAAYPIKGFAGKATLDSFVEIVQNVVHELADSSSVQLAQPSKTGAYRLRYTRCGLSNQMRLMNEVLPEFDFDPFTTNISVTCTCGSKIHQEAALRLKGLPIRIGGH